MLKNYDETIKNRSYKLGKKIDESDINKNFIQFFNSNKRIEVKFIYGDTIEIKRGRIGITTGYKPVFLLMARINSSGSSDIILDNCEFIKIIS